QCTRSEIARRPDPGHETAFIRTPKSIMGVPLDVTTMTSRPSAGPIHVHRATLTEQGPRKKGRAVDLGTDSHPDDPTMAGHPHSEISPMVAEYRLSGTGGILQSDPRYGRDPGHGVVPLHPKVGRVQSDQEHSGGPAKGGGTVSLAVLPIPLANIPTLNKGPSQSQKNGPRLPDPTGSRVAKRHERPHGGPIGALIPPRAQTRVLPRVVLRIVIAIDHPRRYPFTAPQSQQVCRMGHDEVINAGRLGGTGDPVHDAEEIAIQLEIVTWAHPGAIMTEPRYVGRISREGRLAGPEQAIDVGLDAGRETSVVARLAGVVED